MHHKVSTYRQKQKRKQQTLIHAHVEFKLMMSTEWLNKTSLSPVYLIMGSRPHTTYINCTKY